MGKDSMRPAFQSREVPRPTGEQLAALDDYLLEPGTGGRMRLRSAAELRALGPMLDSWCVVRARYALVTTELVAWLRDKIAGRSALEIGAGQGDLGFRLGIRQTDLGAQSQAFVASGMAALGQAPTAPPGDIERLEAEEAVRKYSPDVVVAAWITQKFHDVDPDADAVIRGYGVEEARILGVVDAYIHVGNDGPHAGKRILGFRHHTYRPAWLVSRAVDQSKNVIRVWGR